jgi:uncharacterized protein YbjT (DUF2867 family)
VVDKAQIVGYPLFMDDVGKPLNIVVAGATGAVGRNVARLAAALPGATVYALTRRAGAVKEPGVHEVVFDFENTVAYDDLFRSVSCDVLMLALGSTQKKAGKAGLVRVERDYPVMLVQALAKANPKARVGLVSSVGADRPVGTYLAAKADAEKGVAASGLARVIARPSFLLSHREEFRLSEVIVARVFAKPMLWFLGVFFPKSRRAWKYAPVKVEDVADSLLCAVLGLGDREGRVLEGLDLQRAGVKGK